MSIAGGRAGGGRLRGGDVWGAQSRGEATICTGRLISSAVPSVGDIRRLAQLTG